MREQNLLSLSYGKIRRKDIKETEGLLPASFDGYTVVKTGDIVLRLTDLQNDHTSLRVGRATERGIITSAYTIFRPIDTGLSEYLYYALHSFDVRKGFYGMGSGVRQGLGFDEAKSLRLPIPPDDERTDIVAYLDSACANLDAAIAEAKASIEEYKLLRQSVITQTVTKGLDPNVPMKDSGVEWMGRIPEHWEVEQACRVFRQTNTRGNPTLTLLAATQKNGMRPQSEIEGVVQVKENTDLRTFKTVHRDDFVISLRSFQGGFEHSDYEGVCSPAYQTFHAITQIGTAYFKFFFKSPNFVDAMNALTVGIREGRNIRYVDFAKSPLLLPPLEEQGRIAAYLGSGISKTDDLITAKDALVDDLESHKKSLIYEVVTGKRRVA